MKSGNSICTQREDEMRKERKKISFGKKIQGKKTFKRLAKHTLAKYILAKPKI